MESEIIRVKTGTERPWRTSPGSARSSPGRPPAAVTGCCTCSCRTPRRGSRMIELGSGSDPDLLAALAALLPADDRWRHAHGSRGHGRSHVMPALVPPYATVPVLGGRLALGTWQSIALVDVNIDNPDRQVRLSFLRRLRAESGARLRGLPAGSSVRG